MKIGKISLKNNIRPKILVIVSLFLILLPFFFVTYAPSTDLPQHLSQIYLLTETLMGNTELYSINWYAPNNLIYILIAVSSLIFPPLLSGKIVLMIIVLLWGGSIFFLAWKRNRPLANVLLALIFIYNLSLYWGFLNFLIGWPIFVFWIIHTSKPLNKKNWFITVALSLLLYSSHALWFLIACIWLFFYSIFHWKNWKSFIYRLSSVVPIGIIATIWYHFLSSAREAGGFDIAPHWFYSPFKRLTSEYIINSMLGGLRGEIEIIMGIAVVVWILLSIITNYRHLKEKTDLFLLLSAMFFFLIMLFAPDKYMNTIYFAQRWFPIALIFFLLSFPAPVIRKRLLYIITLFLLTLFLISTTLSWYDYQKEELSGLTESLKALPENQRVLGLDFIKNSRYLKGRPFLQLFAYTQVLKGADINFSFARHASGIIQFKKPRAIPWTPGLEWFAERVKKQDFLYFDYVLINGNEDIHLLSISMDYLEPVTLQGRWRLYKVI